MVFAFLTTIATIWTAVPSGAFEFKKFDRPISLQAYFSQKKTIKELDITIETSGRFQILKKSQEQALVNWDFEKPEQIKICIDSTKIVYNNISLKKKSIFQASDMNQAQNPALAQLIDLIKLDSEKIYKKFDIKKNKNRIKASPKGENKKVFSAIEIEVDKNKNVTYAQITETTGDQLEIKFTQIVEKPLTPEQLKLSQCD